MNKLDPHHSWDDYCEFTPFIGRFTFFKEQLFECPQSFQYKDMTLHGVSMAVIDMSGEIEYTTEYDSEFRESAGSLILLDDDGEEIAFIDAGDIDNDVGMQKLINKTFDVDIMQEIDRDACDNSIE